MTKLQQQIDALVRERDALWANPQQEGKWTGLGPLSAENIPVVPTDIQELHGWLSDRNCELRNAMEFGDAELVAKIESRSSPGCWLFVVGGHSRHWSLLVQPVWMVKTGIRPIWLFASG